jgi:nicotinate phosphoribosyltransferase
MSTLGTLYRSSLGLLTDLYELTMAYGYWKTGNDRREAVFHLCFRKHPFDGGFTVAAGLATVLEYLERLRFEPDDLAYLADLRGNDERPLFEPAFLDCLGAMRLTCDVHAIPEGTIVFPQEPLLRVTGPLMQAQLLETAMLNIVNFQTLVATKAARVVLAARGEPVLEFGLRRAQGIDGSLAASRAAYLGGCAATSNVLAGRLFGIPVRGTHAHSWVLCFDDELAAFRAYARAMPNNCVFLVDTYNTLDGVRHAIEVGQEMRRQGHEMIGIRLDSGDLAALSIEARRMLDAAGFPDAIIVASNDLDEQAVIRLKEQGATIDIWGIGTRLVTAYDEPALGGVYKLSALRDADGHWQDKVKLSEESLKTSNPGILQVRRYLENGKAMADVIFDERMPIGEKGDSPRPTSGRCPPERPEGCFAQMGTVPFFPCAMAAGENLLTPVFRNGERVGRLPSLEQSRTRLQEQLATFDAAITRLADPDCYPVGLESRLHQRKAELTRRARGSPI